MKNTKCDNCGKLTSHTISEKQKKKLDIKLFCDECEAKQSGSKVKKKKKKSFGGKDILGFIFGISLAWIFGAWGFFAYIIGVVVGIWITRNMLGSKYTSVKVIYWVLLVLLFIIGSVVAGERRQERMDRMLDAYQNSEYDEVNLPKTTKSPEESEQIGNLYRNTKYKFRIKSPEGWDLTPGDGPHIVIQANDDENGSNINIGIMEMPIEYKGIATNITDIGNFSEYIQLSFDEIKQKFPDAILLDSGETKIDNEPAYWMKYSTTYSVLDVSVEIVGWSYQLLKNDFMYTISAGAPKDSVSDAETQIMQSISTFVFENY